MRVALSEVPCSRRNVASANRWTLPLLLLAQFACGSKDDPATKPAPDTQVRDSTGEIAEGGSDTTAATDQDTAPVDVLVPDTSDIASGQVGAVSVTVRNAIGLPISGASLEAASGPKSTTNISGIATLTGLPAGKATLVVKAKGYADAAGQVTVASGTSVDLWIALASIDQIVQLDPSQPISTKTAAVAVSASAAAFVYADGSPVLGELQLAITTIDPSTAALGTAPGPLKELKADGSTGASLAAKAMTDLTFTAGGKAVQLKAGAKAAVSMTIPTALNTDLADGSKLTAYWFDPPPQHGAAGRKRL